MFFIPKTLSDNICRVNVENNLFNIMHVNIQCLKNKYNTLESILINQSFNIVMISEHWLKDEEKDLYQIR